MSPNKKKVLVIHYSQSGQLSRLVSSVTSPLVDADQIETRFVRVEPETAYPFPWDFFSFMDVFPESVYLDAPKLNGLGLDAGEKFDLILLAYQVWFLSPSLPMTAFLKSEAGRMVLKDTPVISLIGCRNMWAMAHETVKKLLSGAQARLIDNVALIDQGASLASFITTPRWLLTGRKDAFWWFPPAGISDEQISRARRFGLAIRDGLADDREKTGLPMLTGLQAVQADVGLIQSEKTGYRSFRIWGRLLRSLGAQGSPARKPALVIYLVFLVLLIVTVVPINMLVRRVTAPLFGRRHRRLKEQYELPSGSGTERMGKYTCQD